MFRFFSCMFGQTPKEREQSEHIKKQSKHIKKQEQKIEQLKNNDSWKVEDLEKQLKESQKLLNEHGNYDDEIYAKGFSDGKNFNGISSKKKKTDDESKEKLDAIKKKHKKNDK